MTGRFNPFVGHSVLTLAMPYTATTTITPLDFLTDLSTATVNEASLLIKYATNEQLATFQNIAKGLLNGSIPTTKDVAPFKEAVEDLAKARSSNDVKKVFLGEDLSLYKTTTMDFLNDLAIANEKEGNLLMKYATEQHLTSLRDVAIDLLLGKVQITDGQRTALDPFWMEIRELALAKSLNEILTTLRNHFAGRFLLLQAIVIPTLMHDKPTD